MIYLFPSLCLSLASFIRKIKGNAGWYSFIYLVLRINSIEKVIHTRKYLHKDYFDNGKGKVKRRAGDSMHLNAVLQSKLRGLERIVLEFEQEGRTHTHEAIITTYQSDGKIGFVEFGLKEWLSKKSSGKLLQFQKSPRFIKV